VTDVELVNGQSRFTPGDFSSPLFGRRRDSKAKRWKGPAFPANNIKITIRKLSFNTTAATSFVEI
jgi:hypothetical protein